MSYILEKHISCYMSLFFYYDKFFLFKPFNHTFIYFRAKIIVSRILTFMEFASLFTQNIDNYLDLYEIFVLQNLITAHCIFLIKQFFNQITR